MIDLVTVASILDVVNIASIHKLILKKEENGVLVGGFDNDRTICVHHLYHSNFITHSVGIHRVPYALGLLNLFDLTQATAHVHTRGDDIGSVDIKQGNKKVSMRFGESAKILYPPDPTSGSIVNSVALNRDTVHTISNAASALNPEIITLKGVGAEIQVYMSEPDTNNNFVDTIGNNKDGTGWDYSWRAASFLKMIKQASKDTEEVVLGINEKGLAILTVSDIAFTLIPQSV